MFLASDNGGPVLPAVMQAMLAANEGYAPAYGADPGMARVETLIRKVFEAPQASVHLVATGTAANALALATLTQPWQTVFCTPLSHIANDECNAPEFYTGGAPLCPVGPDDKMTPAQLQAAIAARPAGNVHGAQPGPLSLSQVTEMGRLYTPSELSALCDVAHGHGLPVHMDGARLANALVALGCSPAEITWKAGIDAVGLGGTKNGCAGVEAVVFFDPSHAWEFQLRRKRGAHLFSKHRFLSAQMLGYLEGDAWLKAAQAANANAARLAAGLRGLPQARFLAEAQANMIFATLPRHVHQRLHAAGAVYYLNDPLEGDDPQAPLRMRLVCDWSLPAAQIDRFIEVARG